MSFIDNPGNGVVRQMVQMELKNQHVMTAIRAMYVILRLEK